MIRSAISPRLAMSIFENMGSGFRVRVQEAREIILNPEPRTLNPLFRLNQKQCLSKLDGLAVLDEDARNGAAAFGLDVVEDLHRLDDADIRIFLDFRSDSDKWLCPFGGRGIE